MESPSNHDKPKEYTQTELQSIMAFRQHSLDHIEMEGKINIVVSEWHNDCEITSLIAAISKWIAQSEKVTLTLASPEIGSSYPYIRANMLGSILLRIINYNIFELLNRWKMYAVNPYIEVFLRNIYECAYPLSASEIKRSSLSEISNALKETNRVIEEIKREINTNEFKMRVKNFERAPNKALSGLRDYVSSLFEIYSELCFTRVNLFLNENIYFNNHTREKEDSIEEPAKHINSFIRGMTTKKMSGNLFDNCVGYIIKRAYSFERGYYFHAVIIFDGRKVKDDSSHAKMIGVYWGEITGGIGSHFDCNLSPLEYARCGIGNIHHDDTDRRDGIDKALIYITKPDYYMRLKIKGNARNLRRGEISPLTRNCKTWSCAIHD